MSSCPALFGAGVSRDFFTICSVTLAIHVNPLVVLTGFSSIVVGVNSEKKKRINMVHSGLSLRPMTGEIKK